MLVTLGGQRVNICPQWRKTKHRQDVYDLNCSYVICTVNLYRLSFLTCLPYELCSSICAQREDVITHDSPYTLYTSLAQGPPLPFLHRLDRPYFP